ncbi:MAG: carbohydrate binding family 9 domain-containing protein, partial [Schleiferiaceae bacterium]|nr:carbohydrate binding family 9 domain-containing protein [Schleiferiaceae bacterium]
MSLPNAITAVYTDADIRLDGRLNEPIWDSVPRISNFTQRELFENMPASERTEVAIIYTDKNLYIGVWCYDSQPEKIVAKEFRRDFDRALEDNFQIIIDTYGDHRNGFLFAVNPNAARADLQVFDNGKSTNAFWNGVWDARTQVTREGWFAEIEIPFSTLKYQVGEDGNLRAWGINFERNIQSKREQVLWQGWSRDASLLWVNRAGTLLGLEKITNKQFVELKPYAIAGAENRAGQ